MIALLDRIILHVGPCLSWLQILLSSPFLPGTFSNIFLPRMFFSQPFTSFMAFLKCHLLTKVCIVHSISTCTPHHTYQHTPDCLPCFSLAPSLIHPLASYLFVPSAVWSLTRMRAPWKRGSVRLFPAVSSLSEWCLAGLDCQWLFFEWTGIIIVSTSLFLWGWNELMCEHT